MTHTFNRRTILIGGLFLMLGSLGCSGTGGVGEVTGKVTIDGKPVTAGNVVFMNKDGTRSGSAAIRGDGTYTMPDAPAEEVKIAVETLMYKDMKITQGKGGKFSGEGSRGMELPDANEVGLVYVPIPEKYEKVETSGLTYTVKKGKQTYNIELTSK